MERKIYISCWGNVAPVPLTRSRIYIYFIHLFSFTKETNRPVGRNVASAWPPLNLELNLCNILVRHLRIKLEWRIPCGIPGTWFAVIVRRWRSIQLAVTISVAQPSILLDSFLSRKRGRERKKTSIERGRWFHAAGWKFQRIPEFFIHGRVVVYRGASFVFGILILKFYTIVFSFFRLTLLSIFASEECSLYHWTANKIKLHSERSIHRR